MRGLRRLPCHRNHAQEARPTRRTAGRLASACHAGVHVSGRCGLGVVQPVYGAGYGEEFVIGSVRVFRQIIAILLGWYDNLQNIRLAGIIVRASQPKP